jgi:hypothetical protein
MAGAHADPTWRTDPDARLLRPYGIVAGVAVALARMLRKELRA